VVRLENEDYFSHRLWDILLPRGGFIVVFEAYADAGGVNGPILSVANFLFKKDAADALNEEWATMLAPILKDQPKHKQYFHMHDFFTRKGPYSYMNDGERDALQRDLIDSAHKHMEHGVVASIRRADYEAQVTSDNQRDALGSPFAMCNLWCMSALAEHLEGTNLNGDIAYAFEDGDNDKKDLEIRLAKIEASQYLRQKYRYYSGRTFLPKHAHHALAAADMLSWEFRNAAQQYFESPEAKYRKFLDVLFAKPLGAQHLDPIQIRFRNLAQSMERANMWAEERNDGASRQT